MMKMTARNSALIVRKIMGPTGHTTQWTVGSSEQQKGRSQNAKELNALVQSEVRKALSKAKSSKKLSGDSSDSESSTGSME